MKPLQHLCDRCKSTDIYWNSEDKTMKDTGSWYNVDTDTIHTLEQCKKAEREYENNNKIADVIFQESTRSRY